jgi:TetR/AcrR family acrAB operon transcriptional repressor
MVRCTKEEALATRHRLLDAAEQVFAERGVSRTTLADIAQAAGTTRGAIYWHFKNKADLFNAMMERTTLPMEQGLLQIGHDPTRDPLEELQASMLNVMHLVAHDEHTRRVFEIATLKVEYVDELCAIQERHTRAKHLVVGQMARSLHEAAQRRGVALPIPADVAAQGLHAIVSGLIQDWLLTPQAFDLEAMTLATLQVFWRGLALQVAAA